MTNEEQRIKECVPLDRDINTDELFFCGLGTLFCTNCHTDYEWLKHQHEMEALRER